MKIYIQIPEKI